MPRPGLSPLSPHPPLPCSRKPTAALRRRPPCRKAPIHRPRSTSSRLPSARPPRPVSTDTRPAVQSKGGPPRRVSVVELEKYAATSPSTALPAQTADWMRSSALFQRADVKSQYTPTSLHPTVPRHCLFADVDNGASEHGVMRLARPSGAVPRATINVLGLLLTRLDIDLAPLVRRLCY